MQDYELTAWLGGTEVTDDQRDALMDAADMVADTYPSEDMGAEREQAFSGAAQVILGDDSLTGLASAWKTAKMSERTAMDQLRGAVIASSILGQSENAMATETGITRDTIRKALGKGR